MGCRLWGHTELDTTERLSSSSSRAAEQVDRSGGSIQLNIAWIKNEAPLNILEASGSVLVRLGGQADSSGPLTSRQAEDDVGTI